jgi:hypothetical protein
VYNANCYLHNTTATISDENWTGLTLLSQA